jgi:hypothetical protein
MSTILTANLYFDDTGNNQLAFWYPSNVTFIQNGANCNLAFTTSHGLSTGDYHLSINTANTTSLVGLLEVTNTYVLSSTYPALANLYAPTLVWTNRTAGNTGSPVVVVYGNGVFVVAGAGGTIQSSIDGAAVTWTSRTAGNTSPMFTGCYGNGVYILAGTAGAIQTSTDGITWTNRTSANTSQNINGAAYGNGVYVLAGSTGAIQSSTDGTNWTNRTSANTTASAPPLAKNSITTYGNGVFVSCRNTGIMTSPDGTNWTNQTPANNNPMFSVTYGNGIFVAVGTNGAIQTSPNGSVWTDRPNIASVGNLATGNLNGGVVYGNGYFIAAGNTTFANCMIQSADGINWKARQYNPSDPVICFGYGNGVFVFCSSSGVPVTATVNTTHFQVAPYLMRLNSPIANTSPELRVFVRT